MGGIPFTVKAYNVPANVFDDTYVAIQDETERLEAMFSVYRDDSELALINREGKGPVSDEVMQMIRLATRISGDTDGAFDISVGPLIELWRYCASQRRLPTTQELAQRKALVDWRQVLTSSRGTVTLKQKNMSIDLGGIAKGYIADMAARKLKAQGIKRGIIDAGGDLVLFNTVGEDSFKVGIRDPRWPDDHFAILETDNGAVVTSGCYERNVIVGNKRLCHIINPHTGQPVDELSSTTIVAEEAATADALATAVMVLGLDGGKQLINSLPGVEGVLIWETAKGLEWWISAGLQGKVRIKNR